MIPALLAHQQDDPDAAAHAVREFSDWAFCGQLTIGRTVHR